MKQLLMVILIAYVGVAGAQDSHFTVFENALTYYNPATNGLLTEGDYRVSNTHTRQWRKLVKPARAMNLSFDLPLFRYSALEERKTFLGLGANVFTERYGSAKFSRSHINLALMGGIKSDHHTFTVGVQVGSGRQTVDFGSATWDSQFDGYEFDSSLPTNELAGGKIKGNYLDVGTGMAWLWQGDNNFMMHTGASYVHANAPNVELEGFKGYEVQPKVTLYNKTEIPLQFRGIKRMGLSVFGLYGFQGPHTELLAGGSLRVYLVEPSKYTHYKGNTSIELGGAYRYGDAIALILNYHHNNYNVGFSYDITTSNLREAVSYRGGMELSFTYYGALEWFHAVRRGR